MKFEIIYVDPPWAYTNVATSKGQWGGAAGHYKVMTLDEICALPVPDIAAKDCLLAMWWVPPMPDEALRVMRAWGFKLKTMKGFSWHKRTTNGLSHFGMGTLKRGNTEDCLFAVRGKPKRKSASVRSFIDSPRRAHSQKPEVARERLVELMGDVPRVELFARNQTPGWKVWGHEVASDIRLGWPTLEIEIE